MMPALRFEDVWYTYPARPYPALRGVTASIPAGQRVIIMGRNGSGKSTLLLHGNGILRPQRGRVYLEDTPLRYDRAGLRTLRRRVGIVFQNPDDQLFSASVMQDISFGPMNLGLDAAEVRHRVHEAASLCGVRHLLNRPTHALSGGEKTRVALAGVLAMQPDILLVDELTCSLDPAMRQQVLTIFERLIHMGKTVVLATHDVDLAFTWGDWIILLHEGRVLAAGPTADIFSHREWMHRAGLVLPTPIQVARMLSPTPGGQTQGAPTADEIEHLRRLWRAHALPRAETIT